MNDKFVILHLSDAHLGHPKYSIDSLNIFEPLYKDLETSFQNEHLKPNLIIFSGDLAYGDIPERKIEEQYITAKQFLESICMRFGSNYGDIPILIVPGNHDIDRNKIADGDKLLRDTFTEDIVDNLMYENKFTWERIIDRQSAWFSFVSSIPNQPWQWNSQLHMSTGIINHHDSIIGIAGLNSSWASHEEKENGSLWIGKRQYELAYEAIKHTNFKIAVAHHPPDFLHAEDKKSIRQKIETQFHFFLHGHEHVQWFTSLDGHLRCEAGACYNGSKEHKGYSWIVLADDLSEITIYLREYTHQGSGGWRANHIPGKTDDKGMAHIRFGKPAEKESTASALQQSPILSDSLQGSFPNDLEGFLRILVDRFYFRWESSTIQASTKPLIYWPVRLRQPTPIHASQCFAAAGLQKLGCRISLWTDDLGTTDYSYDVFIQKLKYWYARAGGNESQIERRTFSKILNTSEHMEPAWSMLQKWLGTMAFFTDQILKVSKIWPSTEESSKEEPEIIIKEFSKCRPRRLMTPSMVWTCLLILHKEIPSLPIITLGGYDEKELWDAWRTCCGLPDMQVGHLYVSKLTKRKNDVEQAIRMKVDPLAWTSKEDIEGEFRRSLLEIDSPQTWSNVRSMIPWTINNCALLPSFVENQIDPIHINGHPIRKLDDLKHLTPSAILDELVGAINKWLF